MAEIVEITDFSDPVLDPFARLTERELCPRDERDHAIFIAESPMVIHRALDAGFEPVSLLLEKSRIPEHGMPIIQRCGDIPVYTSTIDVLTKLTGFQLTRGILCAMRRKPEAHVEEICQNAHCIAVLEDVVNPTNIGAIFRSAAALGIDAVLLTPACSDPLYRRCVRVSMGTVFQVPWARIGKDISDWPDAGMQRLSDLGFQTVAMALRDDALALGDARLYQIDKLAIVLGTEGDGLRQDTIAKCHHTVKIPMFHGVDSLNVAAASAVVFWDLVARRKFI